MASEGFQACRGELHGATAAFGLRSPEHRAILRGGQRAPHLQRSGLKVNVAPLEAEQLALTKPGVDGEDVEGFESVTPHGLEQYLHLLCGQRSYLLFPDLWRPDRFGGVAWNEAIGHGLLESLVEGDMDVLNRAGRKPTF